MRTLACTVAAAALLLAAPVALAHQGNPNYRSVVKSVTPQTSGIDARILNFDDAVLVHNTSGKDVVILDYKQQPYVELKADGTVSVNTNSEAYYLNEDRQGETAVPKNLGSEPKWEEISKSGRYEWHDHRMHWMGAGDPPNLTDKGKETVIYDNWEIPIQVAGTAGDDHRHADLGPARRRRAADGRDLRLRRADHRALDRGLHRPPPARARAAATARRARPRSARSPWRRGEARARLRRSRCSRSSPAVASAHATLQETIPKRGEKLDAAPAQVVFRFDEPVEAAFGALRVFDAEGNEVQTGEAFHPGGRGAEIAIKLKPGLGDGTYTATYRVVSADGHAISSGFVFAVGDSTAPAESLETLLADSGTGPVTNTALAFARGFQYAAIALGLGTLIFFLYCWRGASTRLHAPARAAAARRRARRLRLRGDRGDPAGRRRPGRHVLGGRQARRGQRGARHPLRPRLGHRRRGLAGRARRARAAPAAGRGALANLAPGEVSEGTPRGGGDANGGGDPRPCSSDRRRPARARRRGRRGAASCRPRPSPPRAPCSRPSCSRSPSPSSRSPCCRRSAATRACRSRSRSCCPPTSCTCWR